jgi:hypothetical protein
MRVAALRSDRGASRRLLLSALDRKIQVIVSVPLMIEYEAVPTRQHQLAVTGLSIGETNPLLDGLGCGCRAQSVAFPLEAATEGSGGRDGFGDSGKW